MSNGIILIGCFVLITICFAIFGAINVISSSNKGDNWGRAHMRDLGLDEEPNNSDKDLKSF